MENEKTTSRSKRQSQRRRVAFYFMTLVLRVIPVGVTYAIWSGLGIVLVTVVGFFLYRQTPDIPAMLGMGLIISGVVVIHVFSRTYSH